MSFAVNQDRAGKIIPLIIFLSVLIIYLCFPTKNYYWDAVEFSQTIEDAANLNQTLLHPNHLFYDFLGYLGWQFALKFDSSIRALQILQIISSIFGAGAVAVFYVILRNVLRRVYLNFSLAAIFAFSATWWKFSTDGGSYIPSIFFMLVSFYLVLPGKKTRPVLAALTHTAAMILHQLAVFFFPVVILGIILQTVSNSRREKIYALLKYVVPVFVFTFGAFYLSFHWLSGSWNLKEFFTWVTWYSPEIGFVFTPFNIAAAFIQSHAKLMFDGRLKALKFDFLNTALLGLLIVSAVTIFVQIGRDLKIFSDVCRIVASKKFYTNRVFLLCATWLVPYLLFLAFFIPGNSFYKLFYVPPVIIVVGLIADAVLYTQSNKWRLELFAAIIFLANFIFYVFPSSDVREDSPLSLAYEMQPRWNFASIVYYDKINTDTRLVRYFNRGITWLPMNSPDEFTTNLQKDFRAGKNVWLDDTALQKISSTPELAKIFTENYVEKERFRLNDPAHDVKFVKFEPKP